MKALFGSRIKLDPFLGMLLVTVAVATVLPASGRGVAAAEAVTDAAIVLLFFLHGAKLSRQAIVAGIRVWRVHLLVLAATFILFPLVGLGVVRMAAGFVTPGIAAGLLFLCLLPSTVQSSIALTAMAGGNVPAAVCSASLSNIVGIALTPLLVALVMGQSGAGISPAAIWAIVLQLLVPFLAGHLSRPLIGAFVDRHRAILGRVDRSAILLVVYTSFSASVVGGLWQRTSLGDLLAIFLLDALILAVVLAVTTLGARRLGFPRQDEIVIVFCGSKKSLASGVPMAGALFPASMVGSIVLPLMLFHQMQLMVCTILAQRYTARPAAPRRRAEACTCLP